MYIYTYIYIILYICIYISVLRVFIANCLLANTCWGLHACSLPLACMGRIFLLQKNLPWNFTSRKAYHFEPVMFWRRLQHIRKKEFCSVCFSQLEKAKAGRVTADTIHYAIHYSYILYMTILYIPITILTLYSHTSYISWLYYTLLKNIYDSTTYFLLALFVPHCLHDGELFKISLALVFLESTNSGCDDRSMVFILSLTPYQSYTE